ncbi:hypothetical protein [Peribacillus muralis]|uniref:hypothetical protein n=1 Tax=Peribacillus muralis TaxID=264697 RepID=UPI000AB2DF35|nr:hypothetical protein [Peribacillus muralis]
MKKRWRNESITDASFSRTYRVGWVEMEGNEGSVAKVIYRHMLHKKAKRTALLLGE